MSAYEYVILFLNRFIVKLRLLLLYLVCLLQMDFPIP